MKAAVAQSAESMHCKLLRAAAAVAFAVGKCCIGATGEAGVRRVWLTSVMVMAMRKRGCESEVGTIWRCGIGLRGSGIIGYHVQSD